MLFRRLCTLLLITATLGVAEPSPVPSPPVTAYAMRTLANGLRVIAIEDHAAPVVQTAMWYRFGSLDETPGKTGLAHALEHMMFRGTPNISGGGIDEITARLGALANADTHEDFTHFYFILPADRLELALRIEADRMRNLLLHASDWNLERGAVLSEYDGDVGQPLGKLSLAVRAAAYRGSPFALTPLGVRGDITHATTADLRAYYDRWYAPNNATLVVTGDIHPDDVFALAERAFGGIAPIPQTSPAALATPQPRSDTRLTLRADYPYTVVDCAYRIPGDVDDDAAATSTFATLIDNPRSVFYKNLALSNLTLNYAAFPETALHAGVMHVQFVLTPGVSPATVERVFQKTLAQTIAGGVDADLLSAAKIAAARQAVYARDSIGGLGDRYGYALAIEGRDPAVDDRNVEALDVATMNAAVKKYFASPAVIGVLKPRVVKVGAAKIAPPTSIADDFSKRPPSGPVVLAPWARTALAAPVRLSSNVAPQTFALPNGLRVYVQPVTTNPTVFISGSVEVTPAFDPPTKTGTGALVSTLLGYGSAKYDFEAQQRVSDELGADVNVGFNFGAHGLARDLDKLFDVLADAERRPAFPEQYVELVRAQEIAAVSQRNANPDALAERAFAQAIYAPGDPALREETTASLKAISRADLQGYAARYLRPDHTTIVVAGDVDAATVRTSIARAFGTWQNRTTVASTIPPPLPPTRAAIRVIPTDRGAVSIRMGERALGRSNPDFYAFNLLNGVLGADGAFDTRLMHEIREQRGLVYGVSSSLAVTRTRGLFEIAFSAAPHNVAPAVRLVKAALTRVRTQPVTQSELDRARTKLIASTLVEEESTQSLVSRCESIARFRLPTDYFRTFGDRYARYTPRDLLVVARRYLRPDSLVEVYEGGGR